MASKDNKNSFIDKQYAKVRDTLSRKIDGISISTEKKLLDMNDGSEIRSEILLKLAKRYDKPENASLAEIEGKMRSRDNIEMKDFIPQLLEQREYREMIAGGLNVTTSETVRSQLYIKQFMPQVAKSLDAIVTMTVGPKSQNDNGIELKVINGQTKISDIESTLKGKEFDEINRSCVASAIDHGVSYMYIIPYRKMATNILDIAKNASVGLGASKQMRTRAEENRLIGMSYDTSANDNILVRECSDGSYDIDKKLFSEACRTLVCPEVMNDVDEKSSFQEYVKNKYFSESPYLFSTVGRLISEVENNQMQELFSEANSAFNLRSKTTKYNSKYLNKLSGCHVEKLDNERCVPIYIANKLLGLYYIEDEYNNIMKQIQQQKSKLRDDITSRANLNIKVKEEITRMICEELDEKFLANNRHVMSSIDSILRDVKRANTEFRVRFIPAEYIVEYSNFNRQSQMYLVEALAQCWIQLFKNYMFGELFYKKDKIVTYFDISYNDDIGSQGNIFLDTIRNMVPLPSEILNLRKMYMGMINSQRLLIPKIGDEKPFEIDKIEGQKDNGETLEALTKIQGWVTELIGFNYNLMDSTGNVDFALQIVKEDRNKAELILSLQNRFNKPLSEAISKIVKYEFGDDPNLDIEAKFFECREIKEQFYSEQTEKITAKIELLQSIYLPQDADAEDIRYFKRRCFELFAPGFIFTKQMNEIIEDLGRKNATEVDKHSEEEEINNENGDDEFDQQN